MGLSVVCGGADVSEGAALSEVDNGRGLGGGGTRSWVRYRFLRVFGELWEDFLNILPFCFNFYRDVFLFI